MALNPTILVVEDDADIRQYLVDYLNDNNYVVHALGRGIEAINEIEKINPDLLILDLGLPDIDGKSLTTQIKKNQPELPIIILTAHDEPKDIVAGLNLGADDYVTKPFSSEELLARIKARLRQNKDTPVLEVADLSLNTDTLDVIRGEDKLQLTPTEFKLLHYLMSNQNRVLTREMILSHVWSYSPDVETRVVDVYVGYLRKKVDKGKKKKLIHSVRGFGYTLKET